MKNNSICYLLCIIMIICLSVSAGCGHASESKQTLGTAGRDTAISKDENDATQSDPASAVRIGIYTIDPDSFEIVSVDAMINTNGSITTGEVLSAVILMLEDDDVIVGINSEVQDGSKLFIDLHAEDEYKPLGDISSEAEAAALDCLCYSIFDNFEDIKEIYFSVDGDRYESGHILIPKEEPYQVVN